MQTIALSFIVLVFSSAGAFCQSSFGPFHRPATIVDVAGTNETALLVYKDKTIEMYVPDITDRNNYYNHYELLKLKGSGSFDTTICSYDIKTEVTGCSLVSVDHLKKTVRLQTDAFSTPTVISFAKVSNALGHAILNIANLMEREIAVQGIR